MSKLTTTDRLGLREAVFGMPDERKYPMPDVGHARAAKLRARQQYQHGALSEAEYNRIMSMADIVLSGGSFSDDGEDRG